MRCRQRKVVAFAQQRCVHRFREPVGEAIAVVQRRPVAGSFAEAEVRRTRKLSLLGRDRLDPNAGPGNEVIEPAFGLRRSNLLHAAQHDGGLDQVCSGHDRLFVGGDTVCEAGGFLFLSEDRNHDRGVDHDHVGSPCSS